MVLLVEMVGLMLCLKVMLCGSNCGRSGGCRPKGIVMVMLGHKMGQEVVGMDDSGGSCGGSSSRARIVQVLVIL